MEVIIIYLQLKMRRFQTILRDWRYRLTLCIYNVSDVMFNYVHAALKSKILQQFVHDSSLLQKFIEDSHS